MRALALLCAASISLSGCASFFGFGSSSSPKDSEEERGYFARTTTIDAGSIARKVLEETPLESAMERFELLDAEGRTISYVAFTDTNVGGLVFVNQKIYGTVTHRDAQAFYSCRGYITAMNQHWAQDAAAWGASLLKASTPVKGRVELKFSGMSTTQSLKEVVKNNPLIDQVKSLVNMGTNPLSVFKTLDRLNDNMNARDRYTAVMERLRVITPGMGELQVADVIMPEEVSFTQRGVVMAYPSHLVEYFVNNGIVQVIQQPSFNYLARTQVTLFYVANAQWSLCTPNGWQVAFPELKQETWEQRRIGMPEVDHGVRRKKPSMAAGLAGIPSLHLGGGGDLRPSGLMVVPDAPVRVPVSDPASEHN